MLARVSLGLAALLITAACASQEADPAEDTASFDFGGHIGWMHEDCLAIGNPGLETGTRVTIVALGDPQSVLEAEVAGPVTLNMDCNPLIEGRRSANVDQGNSFYLVTRPSGDPLGLAVGVVGLHLDLTVVDGLVRGDLDGDGRDEVFTECATSEGINFGVWTGTPYEGRPRWSAYYYLDYDLEPTCPDGSVTNDGANPS